MRIAIYGRTYKKDFIPYINLIFSKLNEYNAKVLIYKSFYEFATNNGLREQKDISFFTRHEDFDLKVDFFISIGGDGTFLESVQYVREENIPIIGINSGRLGFLANIAREEIELSLTALFNGSFSLDERTLIKLDDSKNSSFGNFNYALNEVTIQKTDSAMITINTYLNDEYLNAYWTDGLIISTPTGSTAYSLSVGGPILTPDSCNFVISPIASHNLTVRPIVVPDSYLLKLNVKSRNNKFLATLDSRVQEFTCDTELFVTLAGFTIKMIKIDSNSFYSTIRNKLMWGIDKRN
ncbi:MAG: NAD kinase [Cyclobacteriaceae bacterium]